jgi:hypothetical protein
LEPIHVFLNKRQRFKIVSKKNKKMSSFYYSVMSRHLLTSQSHFLLYLVHSLFVIPALSIPMVWIYWPVMGLFLMNIIFPIMILSGFYMTFLTRKKPNIVPIFDIFTAYVFSYFVWGIEWVCYFPWRIITHIIAFMFFFYCFYRLNRTRSELRIELLILLSPLLASHFLFYQQSKVVAFSIVSWTGTLFTLSHAQYWGFYNKL